MKGNKPRVMIGLLTLAREGQTSKGVPKIVVGLDVDDETINFHDFSPGSWDYDKLLMTEVKVYYEAMTYYNNLKAIIPSSESIPLEALTE